MSVDWSERRSGWERRAGDARSDWDIDYARIIHSASFRRLQGKTQILNLGDSDFYRTRLTHSLEVAQIAASITRQVAHDNVGHPAVAFLPGLALVQAIGSTHDLGHPPFGHGGEVALNYCMRDSGGFEGNGQTLRILSRLEKFSANFGSDPTRRTLLATLKYPVAFSSIKGTFEPALLAAPTTLRLIDRHASKPPKCYLDTELDVVDWILQGLRPADRDTFTSFAPGKKGKAGKPQHKSLDCSIMDVADDLSFGVHDFEDAVALRLVSNVEFEQHVPPTACSPYLTYLKERYPDEYANDVYSKFVDQFFGESRERKHAISRLVGYFVASCEIEERDEFEEPLLRYRIRMQTEQRAFLEALKALVYEVVIQSPAVQHLEFKGQQMVVAVFETLASEPRSFLPRDTYQTYLAGGETDRIICDHVAGMTDSFLLKTYERLFSPRFGSVFDKL
jgi:dGTPase